MAGTSFERQAVLCSLALRLKRGAEDVLPPLTNGGVIGAMTVENDAKKAKLDASVCSLLAASAAPLPPPHASRVVHLRNVPSDMTDLEALSGKRRRSMAASPLAVGMDPSRDPLTAALIEGAMQEKASSGGNLLVLGGGGGTLEAAVAMQQQQLATQQQPNSVLRIIIENMLYPVTLDVLHAVLPRIKQLHIYTFQALIQLSEANAAQMARQALDGQNVYNGCCTLRIDYSKLATLNVKYNNDKSRDYTNPNLPSGELTLEQQLSLVSAAAASGAIGPATLASLVQSPFAFPFGTAPTASFALPQASTTFTTTPGLTSAALASGAASPAATSAAVLGAASANALRGFPQLGVISIPPVILASNLDENKVTPDALFTLFGVYGDVQRVKILFNKKDNALIQYAEPAQAQLAIQHLDKVRWNNKQMRVTSSKHNNVQMPKEGQPDAGLTRDYAQSPLHRFKKPGSKNYMNIYPPSSTLHLSNIPAGVSEDLLAEAFAQAGFQVKGFKFFPKDHKMALLQLEDVEQSIDALIAMHNFKLADNAHLRVSFSKSGI